MIRTLTIVEYRNEKENIVEYTVNGELPLDEAAKSLVVIAYQAKPKPQPQPISTPTLVSGFVDENSYQS